MGQIVEDGGGLSKHIEYKRNTALANVRNIRCLTKDAI